MRVLLTGANGFIGSAITAALVSAGHDVVAVVRSPTSFRQRFPGVKTLRVDMNQSLRADDWISHLRGVDAVINCAGVLTGRRGQSIQAIHRDAPIALFDACVQAGVRRVVQISATGVNAGTDFARTKKEADEYLAGLELDWTILRPSLVYSSDSYGGTSLMRSLAATPFAVPVPGRGEQEFTPIHRDDLVACVLCSLEEGKFVRMLLHPCGPETFTLGELLKKLRAWLGLQPAPIIPIPLACIVIMAKIGDIFGTGAFTTTALRQIKFGCAADSKVFQDISGIKPRSITRELIVRPAGTQDLWHARLLLLRPVLRLALTLLWLASGVVAFLSPVTLYRESLLGLGLPTAWGEVIQFLAGSMDIAIGLLIAFCICPRQLFLAQVLIIVAYTVILTVVFPFLWFEPFGPLIMSIPALILVMVWYVLEQER